MITDIKPHSFMQHTDGAVETKHVLVIYGERIFPEDTEKFPYTRGRVQVLLAKREGGFVWLPVTIRREAGGVQTLTVQFSGRQWLKRPGTLRVMVKVEEMASLAFPFTVVAPPTRPSEIVSIRPDTFTARYQLEPGISASDYYRFQVEGRYLDGPRKMSISVQGRRVPIENLEIVDGTFEASVPQQFWDYPGKYTVRLYTRRGPSRPATITIEAEEEEESEETKG